MYPFIVTVDYYDDTYTPWKLDHVNILLYADSFTEAAAIIEDAQYVPHVENIHILSVGDSSTFFDIPDEMIDPFLIGGGSYTLGGELLK